MNKSSRWLRRSFLKTTASVGAVVATGPFVHGTEQKSGSGNPIVGMGEFRFECLHDWGMSNLPSGHHYGGASHGVTIDREGNVYITHHGSPGSIFVFDSQGKFIRSMGEMHMIDDPKTGNRVGRGMASIFGSKGRRNSFTFRPTRVRFPIAR